MKINYLLFGAMALALASCSTAYRTAQTPDDVYYSPAPEQNSYVTKNSEQDRNSYYYRNEENEIRRGIDNPIYRNSITFSMGMGYGSPYSFFSYNPFGNPFYNPYAFNSFGYDPFIPYAYNPYGYFSPYGYKGMYNPYGGFVYNDMNFYSPFGYGYSPYGYNHSFFNYYSPFYSTGDFRVNTNRGARKYNLNSYNTGATRGSSPRGTAQPIRTTEVNAPVRNSSGVGNVIRRVFTPTERRTYTPPANNNRATRRSFSNQNTRNYNYNETRNYTPSRSTETRSYEPSSSVSTPSSSGNSGGSAPVRTFRR